MGTDNDEEEGNQEETYAVFVTEHKIEAPTTTVHKTSCSRYARQRGDYTSKGYWVGPFSGWTEAKAEAVNIGCGCYGYCEKCIG